MRRKTTKLILCGLMAALCAVFSQIMIPLPFTPIMISLATLAVFLSGALLGPGLGALSMTVYVLIGFIGLPVFAGFTGGIGVLAGPTGGYIFGYIAAAAIAGWFGTNRRVLGQIIAAGACLLAIYLPGTIYFMILTGSTLWQSLILCVLPFIPGDIVKYWVAVWIGRRVKPILEKGNS